MAPARGEDAETIPSASSKHADDVVSPNKGTELSKKHDLPEDPSSENSSPATGYSAKTPTEDGEIVTSGNDETWVEPQSAVREPSGSDGIADAPPLPAEEIPPLPAEVPPGATEEDDGWAPIWEETAQAFYFYNRFTGATQWTNPRVPEATPSAPPGVESQAVATPSASPPKGGYNPAIHGDYDPNAWYAQPAAPEQPVGQPADPAAQYAASAAFNRFTGRFQNAELTPDNFNDENKSKRQMNAFFDVDAAANSHDGRSLKEERSHKKISKTELKQFKEKRKQKKEEKRRAWLRD
jgi:WW domain